MSLLSMALCGSRGEDLMMATEMYQAVGSSSVTCNNCGRNESPWFLLDGKLFNTDGAGAEVRFSGGGGGAEES